MRPLFYPVEVVRGFAQLAVRRASVGLVLCGISEHMEGDLLPKARQEVHGAGIEDRVLFVDDLDHPMFLAALRRATLYLRSHVSDGVCSSVLESLSFGVPVVASENHTRPPGVRCYPAEDPAALADALADVLERRQQIAADLEVPQLSDTVRTEVDLLAGTTIP
jgi:glycosyltransferase involved in cell wall biosynthesis